MGTQHREQQHGSPLSPGQWPFPAAGLQWRHWQHGKLMVRERSALSASKGELCGGVGEGNFCFQLSHVSTFLHCSWARDQAALQPSGPLYTLPLHRKMLPSRGWGGLVLLGDLPESQWCSDLQCPAMRASALVLGFICNRWRYLSEYLQVIHLLEGKQGGQLGHKTFSVLELCLGTLQACH